jgi:predicted PurR-regulated permease PerM
VKGGGVAASINGFRDNVIRAILFYAGFLLFIILFSEEFARALKWLRARLQRAPQYRLIVYPLLLLLIVAAGIIIVTSLIQFSTTLTFSYD